MQKFCPSALQGKLEANQTPRMTRCFTSRLNAVARQTESKAGVCRATLSGSANPCPICCSHNPSPLESSNNNKMCVWIRAVFMWVWMWLCLWLWLWLRWWLSCAVVVVVVVMVSAVIFLCVCYVAVVCPLWCAHVYVLLLITAILWFSAIDHCGCQDTCIFAAGLASHKKPLLKSKNIKSAATPCMVPSLCIWLVPPSCGSELRIQGSSDTQIMSTRGGCHAVQSSPKKKKTA